MGITQFPFVMKHDDIEVGFFRRGDKMAIFSTLKQIFSKGCIPMGVKPFNLKGPWA